MDSLLLPSLMLLALGLSLRMSLRLLYGARGPAPEDGIYLALRILSWALLLFPTALLIVASTSYLSLILLAAVAEACFEFVLAKRAGQRLAAWRLLLAAVEDGRVAAEELRFHQNRFTGYVGRAYRKLVADLNRGMPWQTAIAENPRAFPRIAQSVAGVISRNPAISVRDVYDEARDEASRVLRHFLAQRFSYLATVSLMMVAILTFVAIKIVPAYQSIFADFGMKLPSLTVSFIHAADVFSSYAGAPILLCVGLSLLVAALIGFLYLCDRPVLQPLGDRLAGARHDAQVLRLVAGAIDRGTPLDETLERLSEGPMAYPSRASRRRLAKARLRMSAGDEWQAAFQGSRFITAAEAEALKSSQRVGNLSAVLRHIADRKVRSSTARWAVALHLIFTAVILFFALIILWYAVAMFVPLVNMITTLSH
jgi:type II secretory pathway component PulF